MSEQSVKSNKSIINTIFDKIYVINRHKRYDIRAFINAKLNFMNIEFAFFDEINGYDAQYDTLCRKLLDEQCSSLQRGDTSIKSRENIGQIITYIKLLDDALVNRYQNILILNDNVLFHKDFEDLLNKTKHNIDFTSFDCVWLGSRNIPSDIGQKSDSTSTNREIQHYNISKLSLVNYCTFGTHSIGMNRKFIEMFRKSIDLTTINNCIDAEIFVTLKHNDMKGIVLTPFLIILDESVFESVCLNDHKDLFINRLYDKDSYKYIFEKDI